MNSAFPVSFCRQVLHGSRRLRKTIRSSAEYAQLRVLLRAAQYVRLPLQHAHISLGVLVVKSVGGHSTNFYRPVGASWLFHFADDLPVVCGKCRLDGTGNTAAQDKTQENNCCCLHHSSPEIYQADRLARVPSALRASEYTRTFRAFVVAASSSSIYVVIASNCTSIGIGEAERIRIARACASAASRVRPRAR